MDELTRMARERAMDKIRKLLAMARDGRGNENEAAIAAGQAEKMMRHYQIEAADVVLEEIQREDAFDRGMENVSFEGIAGHRPKQVPSWVGFIALGCGELFTCKVDIVDTPQGLKVRFSGYQLDVVMARWVYGLLCSTVFRVSKEEGKGLGMSFAKSFRVGAAVRLQHRLFAMKKERDDELRTSPAKTSTGTALVLYDRKKERVEEMYGATKTKQTRTQTSDRGAYHAGAAAADQMHIPTERPIAGNEQHVALGHTSQ